MSKNNNFNKTDEEIREEVKTYYKKIESGEIESNVSAEEVATSLGYDKELLDKLPEGVNLGLSCGNPLEWLDLKDGENLLDLGSGAGMDVFLTRIKYPNSGIIYGIDRLEQMVERAKKARDKKQFKNIEFVVG